MTTATVAEPLISPSAAAAAGPTSVLPAALLPSAPVRVEIAAGSPPPNAEAPARALRIAVVVPCFNRRADAEAVLGDLARVESRFARPDGRAGEVEVRVLLVDNASTTPLSTLATPDGVHLTHLRMATNTGGSGGYNAGMRRVLALDEENEDALAWLAWNPDYVWLVDSDARVAPDTLKTLLEVIEADESICAAGSAICDPITGQAFELGGHVNRCNGNYEPMVIGHAGVRELIECDYLAACCALVRADAIRDTGVFPDRFLNGDDIEWFVRMTQMTGQRCVGVPWSVAMHPRFDRFPTWPRYYMTRNAFGPLDAVGTASHGDSARSGRRLRLIRALREVPRAVQQEMMGRPDLARLHIAGLRHAAQGRTLGPAPDGLINIENPRPLTDLSKVLVDMLGMGRSRPTSGRMLPRLQVSDADRALIDAHLTRAGVVIKRHRDGARPVGLHRAVWGAFRRFVKGPEVDVAVVPARGRPDSWFLGRVNIAVTTQGFVIRRTSRMATSLRALGRLVTGMKHSVGIALREPDPSVRPESMVIAAPAGERPADRGTARVTAVVLSYNRSKALDHTLHELARSGLFVLDDLTRAAPFDVLVVDNGSTDGSAEMVEGRYPLARVLRTGHNLGVEAFNRAVNTVESELVLVLDDDAVPDARALRRAVDLLSRRADVAAVTLLPRHPRTGKAEWGFAERFRGRPTDRCPVMGCGNLVRREDWLRAGGYEGGYFLYRNDTDLALKLLGLGRGVHFNPAWVVWHDSPASARKSVNWHRTATRNWIWMARRHTRGVSRFAMTRWEGVLLGYLWSHKTAGLSASRHWATIKGGLQGMRTVPPPMLEHVRSEGAWRELVQLLTRRR